MKKVLIISEVYKSGGSGNATKQIANFFENEKIEFKLLVPYLTENKKNVISYYSFFSYKKYQIFKLILRILTFIISKNKYYFLNNIFNISLYSINGIKKKIKDFNPDYVLILWYEYILNYKTILQIKSELNVKIIIFPFDMFPFTGGCRYSQSCNNFLRNCKNCPAVYLNSIPNKQFLINKNLIKEINPIYMFPSEYSMNFALQTKIFDKNTTRFIFYYPVERKATHNNDLCISSNIKMISKQINKNKYKNIIFFGSQDGNEWRKGMHNLKYLINVYKKKFPENYKKSLFIGMGKNLENIFHLEKKDRNLIIFNFLELKEYNILLDLSDIVIIPSLQEWSSLMLSEAFYKKKIIIGFNTGSSKEYITHGINGFILDPYNSSNFSKTLNFLFKQKKIFKKKKFNQLDIQKKKNIRVKNNEILSYLNIK